MLLGMSTRVLVAEKNRLVTETGLPPRVSRVLAMAEAGSMASLKPMDTMLLA